MKKEDNSDKDKLDMLKENVSMCKEHSDFYKRSVEEATIEYEMAKTGHGSIAWDDKVQFTRVVPKKGKVRGSPVPLTLNKSNRAKNTIEKFSSGYTLAQRFTYSLHI